MLLMMNGRLLDEREAKVSVYDHGFMYGVGLFETLRTYGGSPFLLDRHLQRLHAGCREFGISLDYAEDMARREIARLLKANHLNDAYVRISVSAGKAPLGLPTATYDQPQVVVYLKPLSPAQAFANRPSKTIQVLSLRRNSAEGKERRKSFHYLNNILGKRELQEKASAPEVEGLFLDAHGYIAEGVISNLFFSKDGILKTPSLETGILAGITRAYVIELAHQLGITVEEGLYTVQDLLAADELFVTNSVQEISAVHQLIDENAEKYTFVTGPLTNELAQRYETVRDHLPHVKHDDFSEQRYLPIGERTIIMGILNVTPDSFSDGGQYDDVERAVARAKQMVAEGADLIDVGGESTRPGAEKVALEVELARVIPIVRALREAVQVPISVDTYKAEVARQALAAGAHIINDVSALRADPQMAAVVAQYQCPVILMHNRAQPDYTAPIADEVRQDLLDAIAFARAAGITADNIWLDPGIGFAKTHEHNLQLMNHLRDLVELGYPLVLGTSRKRFIRNTIVAEADDCVEGTAATVAYGISQGCHVIRVHDVRQMKRVAVMCDAMLRA
jgi:dihydropteroate synthase